MDKFSYLKSVNADYIDERFEQYKANPESVEDSWRNFFEGMEFADKARAEKLDGLPDLDFQKESAVAELITAYRNSGKNIANIDPLSDPPTSHPMLDLKNFGLSEGDLGKTFFASKLLGIEPTTLAQIIDRLKTIYCRQIGVEFMHIQDNESREWLQARMESSLNQEQLSLEDRQFILKRLCQSQTWETFLNTRYVAQKRFSLEGGESFVPLIDRIIEEGAQLGVGQVVMGMAHRGRLNVLYNVYGKKAEHILTEFEEAYFTAEDGEATALGDVKYHMGYSADVQTRRGKKVHLALAHNPSHLEFINPVVVGMARAKQRAYKDKDRSFVLPVVIHGDAALSGQGVVYETLNLSQVSGFKTGGTMHIVINNQVGFTTDPTAARSTPYCTDVAQMLEVPIFHVNGDDPEAVWYAAKLALEYRQKFKKDVFVDLVCFRKYGHNEGDEPAFTQPLMYHKIRAHKGAPQIYEERLAQNGLVASGLAQGLIDDEMAKLSSAQERTRQEKTRPYNPAYQAKWTGLVSPEKADVHQVVATAVAESTLKELSQKLNTIPTSFKLHPKLTRFFEQRMNAVSDGAGLDWGNAESLAYASLINEGHPVRITGQDVERGTFTHRHAVLKDFESGAEFVPHSHLGNDTGTFLARNSILSETAVLGFEYGWSLTDPMALVIWEAQFGDFANGAQVIIDQFIASAESKWKRSSGLTMFLPHGYEGQGPEHSSARLERFLQLCGENNFSICNFTTPAQLFHGLRRQIKRNFRKPLVVMSPKSLLRHPMAVSRLSDLITDQFWPVIDDAEANQRPDTIQKVLLCSGKIYYELIAERATKKLDSIAIIRVEELYPWPEKLLVSVLSKYSKVSGFTWVQEEPRNQGAWTYVFGQWAGGLGDFAKLVGGKTLSYVGRKISPAPTTGSHKAHVKTQSEIIKTALSL